MGNFCNFAKILLNSQNDTHNFCPFYCNNSIATIVYSESGELLTVRTVGRIDDDQLNTMISMGKDLSKRIFYLFNHQLLS